MKIYMVISTLLSGGAERNTCLLANYFVKKNDVRIATFQKSKNCFYSLSKKIKINNLNLLKLSNSSFSKILNFLKRIYVIRKNLLAEKPDIVISFLETTNITVLIASLFIKNIKLKIISDRNNPAFTEKKHFLYLLKYFFYKYADFLVLQTDKIKENYKFINKNKIKIIPNTISKDIHIKKNYHLGNKINFLSVGRLEDQKGYEILIQSLKLLKKDNFKFNCDIYGSGSKKNKILNTIKSEQLTDQINLKGVKKNILKEYKEYDVYILSSIFEGYPNSLLEALSSGLVCISSNCNYGPSEMIKNKFNGLLFKNKNHNDLYKKIKYLLSNKKAFKIYGENAKKKFYYKNYNKDKLIKWQNIIKIK